MGRMFNSFKGQLGRDAGRLVSNTLFGDKHATKIKHVSSGGGRTREVIVERPHTISIEELKQQRELEKEIARDKQLSEREHIERTQKELRQVLSMKFDASPAIIDSLCELISILETQKWNDKNSTQATFFINSRKAELKRWENELSDLYLSKYKECLRCAGTVIDKKELKMYTKYLFKFKKRRNKMKYNGAGIPFLYIGHLGKKLFRVWPA